MLGMAIMLPAGFQVFQSAAQTHAGTAITDFDANDIGNVFLAFFEILRSFFTWSMMRNWLWWVFLLFGLCITLHINFSPQDIEGSANGFLILSAVVIVSNLILGLISVPALLYVNRLLVIYNIFLAGFLVIALVFSLLLAGVGLLILAVRKTAAAVQRKRRYGYFLRPSLKRTAPAKTLGGGGSASVSSSKRTEKTEEKRRTAREKSIEREHDRFEREQKKIEAALKRENPFYKSPDEHIAEVKRMHENNK
jgi:hypothetical protein